MKDNKLAIVIAAILLASAVMLFVILLPKQKKVEMPAAAQTAEAAENAETKQPEAAPAKTETVKVEQSEAESPETKPLKVHILGSLSGTEPIEGRHHTSWVLETGNGDLYWFDAGENCSRSAYLKGLDPLRIKAIFISHGHYDHTGGLLNLIGLIGKVQTFEKNLQHSKLPLYLPTDEMAEPFMQLLRACDNLPEKSDIVPMLITDGGVYQDENIKVEFMGNDHIRVLPGFPKKAFSFRITSEGKKIIYSADVRSVRELDKWCADGCDLLLMESGHHSPPECCQHWKEKQFSIDEIMFIHHGREFLKRPQETLRKCRNILQDKVGFADDGTVIEL